MIGFPKYLNSKQDHEYIKTHFPREQWQPHFQALLNTRVSRLNVGKLKSKQEGVADENHEVIAIDDENGQPVEYYQYEFKEDPNCKLFKLGFTKEEVEKIVSEIDKIHPY